MSRETRYLGTVIDDLLKSYRLQSKTHLCRIPVSFMRQDLAAKNCEKKLKRKIKSTCLTLSKCGTLLSATRDKSGKLYLAKCAVVSIYIYIYIYICPYVYKHLLYITSKMRYIPVMVTLQMLTHSLPAI